MPAWRKRLLLSGALLLAGCARHELTTTADILKRLPQDDALIVNLDVDSLRRGGILKLLSQGKDAVEPEYQSFLNGTGFNYERDLDQAVGSFGATGKFLILKGRFDWAKLEAYAKNNGGSCYDKLCRMPGSVPERRISYLPLGNGVMGIAVATDDLAAARLTKEGPPAAFSVPKEPVWLEVPGAVLRKESVLPPATRLFTAALGKSERVTIALGQAASGYELKLNAACQTAEDARVMAVQMMKLSEMLKGFLGKAKSQDLGTLLASGSFSQSGTSVNGVWPVPKDLLDTIAK